MQPIPWRFICGFSFREAIRALWARRLQLSVNCWQIESQRRNCALRVRFWEHWRIDFRLRIARRAKDPLSRAFRVLQKSTARARFDEDVLGLWKEHHPELKQLVSELRAALKFRHWLAHGRYWERPSNGRFDYVSIYDLAVATLFHFPLFRPE
jgi:hypothetical protein